MKVAIQIDEPGQEGFTLTFECLKLYFSASNDLAAPPARLHEVAIGGANDLYPGVFQLTSKDAV